MTPDEIKQMLADRDAGPWRLEEYENCLAETGMRVIDADGEIVCDDEPFYPTDVSRPNMIRISRVPALEDHIIAQEAALAAKDAEIERLRELLKDWQSAGCPYCQGDCASANPPMS